MLCVCWWKKNETTKGRLEGYPRIKNRVCVSNVQKESETERHIVNHSFHRKCLSLFSDMNANWLISIIHCLVRFYFVCCVLNSKKIKSFFICFVGLKSMGMLSLAQFIFTIGIWQWESSKILFLLQFFAKPIFTDYIQSTELAWYCCHVAKHSEKCFELEWKKTKNKKMWWKKRNLPKSNISFSTKSCGLCHPNEPTGQSINRSVTCDKLVLSTYHSTSSYTNHSIIFLALLYARLWHLMCVLARQQYFYFYKNKKKVALEW